MTAKKPRAPKLFGLPPSLSDQSRWVWKFPGATVVTVESWNGTIWEWDIARPGLVGARSLSNYFTKEEALTSLRRFLRSFGKLVKEAT